MEFFNQYQKLGPYIKETLDDPNKSVRFQVKKEKKDRFRKIDSHIIWSIIFHESSKCLKDDNLIFALIGEYYSLFHCSLSYMLLDMSIDDKKFERIRHSQLFGMLKNHQNKRLITERYVNLFNDAKKVREYINYLGEESGLRKFVALRGAQFGFTESYGKVTLYQIKNYILKDTGQLLGEYIKILKYLESISENRYLFALLHMTSDFDYYGEDFLEGFLSEGELKNNITGYLFHLEDV